MQISLPDELENRIRDRVASGQFGSPAEMVGQALRLYETYEAMRSASQTRLKADIDRGIADLQAGRISPLDADSIKKMGREALARAWGPYMMECIETFGPERCMFQSNFPVDKGTTTYVVIWNAFKRIAAAFGADEKRALFLGTAARVYKLPVADD